MAVVLGLRIPLIPVAIERIETYTETEMKKEPYVVSEKKEVKIPRSRVLNFFTRLTLEGGKEYGQIYAYDRRDNSVGPSVGAVYREDSRPERVVAGETAVDSRIVLHLSPRCFDGPQPVLAYFMCTGYGFHPGSNLPLETIAREALCSQVAPSGDIELSYNLDALPCDSFWICVRNLALPGSGLCHFLGSYVEYCWSEIQTQEEQVTTYRELPVPVQKQRAVTDHKRVSLWQWLSQHE